MPSGASPLGSPGSVTIHASCVALGSRAVLISGASGAGKSALALQLMAMGASLVADDRTILTRRGDRLVASAPPAIHGLIEARGVGLLQAETVAQADVVLQVDLDQTETARLPVMRFCDILGLRRPSIHKVDSSHFPAAVLQYLKGGRRDPE